MSAHVRVEGDREMVKESKAVACSDDVGHDEVLVNAKQCSQPHSYRSTTIPSLENPAVIKEWQTLCESKDADLAKYCKEIEALYTNHEKALARKDEVIKEWQTLCESKDADLAKYCKEINTLTEKWKKCCENDAAFFKSVAIDRDPHATATARKYCTKIEKLNSCLQEEKQKSAKKEQEIKELEELNTVLMKDLHMRCKHIAAKGKKERDELQAGQISTKPEERSEMSPRSCGGSTRKKGRKGRKGK